MNTDNIPNRALTVFVTVQAINVTCLLVDYILMKTNTKTISDISYEYPAVGYILVFSQCINPIALAVHFIHLRNITQV